MAWGDEFVYSKTLYERAPHIGDRIIYDKDMPLYIAIDQGHSDLFACWFFQVKEMSYYFVDYYEAKGKVVSENISAIKSFGYPIAGSKWKKRWKKNLDTACLKMKRKPTKKINERTFRQ
ncbi:MAG: hypothetical protein LBI30_02975 [Holosporales bacterium]|jgi:hypothetical protein|nr:hypothetical protein [Holosporales bacterium]